MPINNYELLNKQACSFNIRDDSADPGVLTLGQRWANLHYFGKRIHLETSDTLPAIRAVQGRDCQWHLKTAEIPIGSVSPEFNVRFSNHMCLFLIGSSSFNSTDALWVEASESPCTALTTGIHLPLGMCKGDRQWPLKTMEIPIGHVSTEFTYI